MRKEQEATAIEVKAAGIERLGVVGGGAHTDAYALGRGELERVG